MACTMPSRKENAHELHACEWPRACSTVASVLSDPPTAVSIAVS